MPVPKPSVQNVLIDAGVVGRLQTGPDVVCACVGEIGD